MFKKKQSQNNEFQVQRNDYTSDEQKVMNGNWQKERLVNDNTYNLGDY